MIKNLTPHEVAFYDEKELIVAVPPCGEIARVAVHTETIGMYDSIPITASVYGEVEGLPVPEEGVIYLVSSLVASRCQERDDVFIPNESIRDDQGRIIGCKSLGRI